MVKQKRTGVRTSAEPKTSSGARADRRAAKRRAMLEGKLATADQLVAKRTGRLESATAKRAALAARLAELGTSESDERPRPMGYCLKERLRVAIVDPRAVVLANGRPGVAGTCPGCGSRIVRLGAM